MTSIRVISSCLLIRCYQKSSIYLFFILSEQFYAARLGHFLSTRFFAYSTENTDGYGYYLTVGYHFSIDFTFDSFIPNGTLSSHVVAQ